MLFRFDVMEGLSHVLRETAKQIEAFGEGFEPETRPTEARFGDFQANGVLPHAKNHGRNPRELATKLADRLRANEEFAEAVDVEVAGPGFLNFRFHSPFILHYLNQFSTGEKLREGSRESVSSRRVTIDFSSPNTAKQMHVGHIRSTIIGDSLARMLEFQGHEIVRDNHVGDWGTQFGILIVAVKRSGTDLNALGEAPLTVLENLYREGNRLIAEDPDLRKEAQAELVKLQDGDPENRRTWEKINAISLSAFSEVYDLLGVRFDETLGESFYADKVDAVYEGLEHFGISEESDGAIVVFHKEHDRFAKQPFIVRKSDGASNYATTDLATIAHRVTQFQADEIIYVTDGRQRDHFEQLFLTAEKWFAEGDRRLPALRHVWFGTILGENGKAIATRSGEPVKLLDLLHEAIRRAHAIVSEKNPDLPDEEAKEIAHAVGLGSVRYADLSQNRTSDYLFEWDKLLALEGNTAPYLLYAVARIRSIFRKLELDPGEGESSATSFETAAEKSLARKLLFFAPILNQTIRELRPHYLCSYLYDLAGDFASFYSQDKVAVDDSEIRARRLLLCSRTLTALETGLALLGIPTLAKM
jgi:arginyl-tRNA synthetase